MTNVKPIETRYAGCRFRSRLEARWAVFFDHLGIEWQYESEGFELSTGARYLPDFYLPIQDLWVEVKGVLSHTDLSKICRAAVELNAATSGLPLAPRLLVVGPVPQPGCAYLHSSFARVGDQAVWQLGFFTESQGWKIQPFGQAIPWKPAWFEQPGQESATADLRATIVESVLEGRLTVDPRIDAAYARARAARFEHGESG